MRTQGDTAEPNHGNQRHCTENRQQAPVPCFESRQDKKQKLPVKKGGSDGVTTGKTVTRPIHKRAVNKRPLSVNQNLYPLVQKHAAGNSDYERREKRPPSFPCKKQRQRKHNNPDPLTRTEVGERMQYGDKRRGETLMKPRRKLLIGASKWIGQSELREKKCVCHRKSGASLSPIKRKSTNYVNKIGYQNNLDDKIAAKASQEPNPQNETVTNTPEIILAKKYRVRYIAFKLLIRYVDIRVALGAL
jgi:hypothetical protein